MNTNLKHLIAAAAIITAGVSANGAELDLALNDIAIEKTNYTVAEPVNVTLALENPGSTTVTSFTLTFEVNGTKVAEKDY